MKEDITSALVSEHRLILRMLDVLERVARATADGEYRDVSFYLEAVDFIRQYADRFHHAKEEAVLFEALVKNGMPRANSPIAAMLLEHDQGRALVKAMERAAQGALAGEVDQARVIVDNALQYVALLREHIEKEDGILYPLAERVIPASLRSEIIRGYQVAGTHLPGDFSKRYEALVAASEAITNRFAA
ncbi:hemerythrin domain-containing protein [Geobacter argillaceus]|uniref:Hemerythrin-like domain-containing protein n=1 Tax=Geobacter argillaceus TaxID=345631 RepID=A0A562WQG2_9BACT|nr:hemerythrin domain-containing protein [Geobacter argillaceus]TWJ32432.1 hemerythrin-like domain-containing protein [Geobacter argillaceus]